MKWILILEDNKERRAGFERAARALGGGFEVKIWDDPAAMQRECEKYFPYAALISLEHDLNNAHGDGLDIAKTLAEKRPACPVIIHTANSDRCFSMMNELRFADWVVDRVPPVGDAWIERKWAAKAKELIEGIYAQRPAREAWATPIPIAWHERDGQLLRA